MSGLANQIIRSLRDDPEAWSETRVLSLRHDSGTELQWGEPFMCGEICNAVLTVPRRHIFGWYDRWRLIKAVKGWFGRPIPALKGTEQ